MSQAKASDRLSGGDAASGGDTASPSDAIAVSLAEIARIAGVGRAAVSNWRRRHESFPRPVGGSDTSPLFSLAHVEEWLRAQGKIDQAGGLEWLWPRIDALGGRDETARLIAAAGHRLRGGDRLSDGGLSGSSGSDTARAVMRRIVALGRRDGGAEVFEFLLRRWVDVNVRQIVTTPPPLAALMAEIGMREADMANPRPLSVLDPACGVGHLLTAAVTTLDRPVVALGGEKNPNLAQLADARLRFAADTDTVDVRAGDSLRDDPHADVLADLVLSNPPYNERDWGYEELATDARWTHGMPPRTEPELAWVQHALARLRPGGAAVLLLPPAVAARKAGRRIRGSLLRNGVLRAVVALPQGAAPPHSLSLHLWVLRAPARSEDPVATALLVDATRFDEAGVRAAVENAFATPDESSAGPGWARVPVIDLLDDEVDLTPGRHVRPGADARADELSCRQEEFAGLLGELGSRREALAALRPASDTAPTTTIGELARAGALSLRAGRQPPADAVTPSAAADTDVPLLTVADRLHGGQTTAHLSADSVDRLGAVVAEPGDVIVVGVARVFAAWVHEGPPLAVGSQLFVIRVDPARLDAHFLAGSLHAPANERQAGTHTSNASRIDVRKLQVRQLTPAQQASYGKAFATLFHFDTLLTHLTATGRGLTRNLYDALAAGRLAPPE